MDVQAIKITFPYAAPNYRANLKTNHMSKLSALAAVDRAFNRAIGNIDSVSSIMKKFTKKLLQNKKIAERSAQKHSGTAIPANIADCKKIADFIHKAVQLLCPLSEGKTVAMDNKVLIELTASYMNYPLRADSKENIGNFFKKLGKDNGTATKEELNAVAKAILLNVFYVNNKLNTQITTQAPVEPIIASTSTATSITSSANSIALNIDIPFKSEKFTLNGFNGLEANHVWSTKESSVAFNVSQGKKATLNLSLFPLGEKNLTIELNGSVIWANSKCNTAIPAIENCNFKTGENILTFKVPNAGHAGADTRILGVSFSSLKITTI